MRRGGTGTCRAVRGVRFFRHMGKPEGERKAVRTDETHESVP